MYNYNNQSPLAPHTRCHDNMYNWPDKLCLLTSPPQSRKTEYEIIQPILNQVDLDINRNLNNSNHLSIIFSMKTLISSKQLKDRLDNTAKIKTLEWNSKKTKNLDNVIGKLTRSLSDSKPIRCLSILGVPSRFSIDNGLYTLIQSLSQTSYSSIYIIFDEWDSYLITTNAWNTIQHINSMEKDITMTALSATHEKAIEKLKIKGMLDEDAQPMLSERHTNLHDYRLYEQETPVYIENTKNITDDFDQAYSKFDKLEDCNDGRRLTFWPSTTRKKKHLENIEHAFKKGYKAVLLVNGDCKGFLLHEDICAFLEIENYQGFGYIPLKFPENMVKSLQWFIKLYEIKEILITGNLCIGRSITFQGIGEHYEDKNEDGTIIKWYGKPQMFTERVLHPSITKNPDHFLQMDRGNGNLYRIKRENPEMSTLPTLYCTKKSFDDLLYSEKISRVSEDPTIPYDTQLRTAAKETQEKSNESNPIKIPVKFEILDPVLLEEFKKLLKDGNKGKDPTSKKDMIKRLGGIRVTSSGTKEVVSIKFQEEAINHPELKYGNTELFLKKLMDMGDEQRVKITDKNAGNTKFTLNGRRLHTFRKINNTRFVANICQCFEDHKPYAREGQNLSSSDNYCMDSCIEEINKNDIIHPINTFWITYRIDN